MKELEPIINQLTEIIKGTKEFTVTQAPDFIRQFLIKSALDNMGWLVFSVIVLAACIWLLRYLKNRWDRMEDHTIFVSCLGLTFILPASIYGVIESIENLFVIWLAPKAYIVEHLISALVPSK